MGQVVHLMTDGTSVTSHMPGAVGAGGKRAVYALTLTGDHTIEGPCDARDGQHMLLRVLQDATGGHTLTFGSAFNFRSPNSRPAPVLSTVAGTAQEMVFGYSAGAGEWWLMSRPTLIPAADALTYPDWS